MTAATHSAAIAELVDQFRRTCDSAGSVILKELDLFSRYLFPSNGSTQCDSATVAFYKFEYCSLLEVLLQYSTTPSPDQILPFFTNGVTSEAWAACCGALASNKDAFALRVLKELLKSPVADFGYLDSITSRIRIRSLCCFKFSMGLSDSFLDDYTRSCCQRLRSKV